MTVAGDVADATTVSVPSPSGHVTAGLCEAFEKLTRIDIAASSRNASSRSRECVWHGNGMAVG